jgi:hypothetical protein
MKKKLIVVLIITFILGSFLFYFFNNSKIEKELNETKLELEKPVACTREYIPVCAEVQIQCIRAPCDPIIQTFSNGCEAKANGALILYEGIC